MAVSDNTTPEASRSRLTSKRVTDHLANERTFLAWVRTGLATITIGFVVARFGLFLRELDLKHVSASTTAIHYSSLIGIALTILGVFTIAVSLINFLQIRRDIDNERFHPQARYSILLTVLTCLSGVLLAIYLLLTA